MLNKCKFYYVIYNNDNTKVAVIVEPREHEFMEQVIRNVATALDNTWNIHIFTSNIESKNSVLNLLRIFFQSKNWN